MTSAQQLGGLHFRGSVLGDSKKSWDRRFRYRSTWQLCVASETKGVLKTELMFVYAGSAAMRVRSRTTLVETPLTTGNHGFAEVSPRHQSPTIQA